MTRLALAPTDVEDDKGRSALERYTIEQLGPGHALLDAAYGALDAEFGARGELERRAVVDRWLAAPAPRPYHLLVALDAEGRVAAVRDCHVRVDAGANAVVAYLAHVLVLPEHRRSGLASVMRAAPLALARRAASALPEGADLLLAGEMEPPDPSDPATLVRMAAYGKAGYSAIDPESLPYCQPDFRDLERSLDPARPIPLVAIVRWVDHERSATLPTRLARAYLENLYAVFATHCRAQDLEVLRAHSLAALARRGDAVPLVTLPSSAADEERIAALSAARVRALAPPSVRRRVQSEG